VAHTYNPSYSGGRDQEDLSSKPAQANSSRDLSRKTLHKNRTGGVVQGEGPEFKPQKKTATTTKKNPADDFLGKTVTKFSSLKGRKPKRNDFEARKSMSQCCHLLAHNSGKEAICARVP
jgi:hypothetical protein